MNTTRMVLACLMLTIPFAGSARGEDASPKSTRTFLNKHRIDLNVSLLSEINATSEVTFAGTTTRGDANGVVGGVAYTYYASRDFGLGVSVGVMDADATTSVTGTGTSVEAASVVPLLFGVKYQPALFTVGEALRPYASISAGPYFGTASNVRSGLTTSTESLTETAIGARFAIGVDFLLGRFVALGVGGGYHLVSDFDNRIGSEKNYSSPEFALSLGFIFGG